MLRNRFRLAVLAMLPVPAMAQEIDTAAWDAALAQCVAAAETVDDMRLCKDTVAQICVASAPYEDESVYFTCQSAEAMAWDGLLNALWPEVTALADERGLGDSLLAAEQAWLAFRDANCSHVAATAASQGGELGFAEQACLAGMTAERVIDLRMLLAG